MHIAQVAPLYESVPPKVYGGTERVVSHLTEELVRRGHQVTLFASADSLTKASLIPCSPQALRLDPNCIDPLPHHMYMVEKVFQHAKQFDLIHFHIDFLHFPLARRQSTPTLTTLHGRQDIKDYQPIYKEFSTLPVVSISNAQRRPFPHINWQGTVYHGLPSDLHRLRQQRGTYLAFLGRISPEKRVDRAIDLALRCGMDLKIAAKISNPDKEYYDRKIKPMLKKAGKLVEFIGEINDQEKDDFLGNAYALVFLIDWPEPFGLVMIEAMACGTPVIAYPHGSVPEIIRNGTSGYIVRSQSEAMKAIENISRIDRSLCRREFEQRFTVERMVDDYLAIYRQLQISPVMQISKIPPIYSHGPEQPTNYPTPDQAATA